ncbi:MAG: hypothetical protein EXX96DRAFT_647164, partial [Benjaminiella poitrasii]
MKIDLKNRQALRTLAMLKDVCFYIFYTNKFWKKEYKWNYLQLTTSLFKLWLDCSESIHMADLTLLIDEMKQLNDDYQMDNAKSLTSFQIKTLLRSYMYQSEYSSREEKWSESKSFFDKSLNMLSLLSEKDRKGEAIYLYHITLEIGYSLVKQNRRSSVDILYWVICAVDKIFQSSEGETRPASLGYLSQSFMKLIIFICQKDNDSLPDNRIYLLVNTFDKVLNDEKKITTITYYLAKIHLFLKSLSTSNEVIKNKFDKEYFKMVENIVISNHQDLSLLSSIMRKINQLKYITISNLMSSLDLLIRRTENNKNNMITINSSALYLFKIHILSELVIENHSRSIKFDQEILRHAMDDVYLVKEDINLVDLAAIQLILWKTGDIFYEVSLP